MKTAIIYASMHHGNTKKLIDKIAKKHDVCLIDIIKDKQIDLSKYDCIGIASGIAFGKFYSQMNQFIETNLPNHKKVFLLYSYGSKRKGYTDNIKSILSLKHCEVLGEYGCLGFDTYGPFKVIGGISKGHPDIEEINGALTFYESLNLED